MAQELLIDSAMKSSVSYTDPMSGLKKKTYTQNNMASNATAEMYATLADYANSCRISGYGLTGIKRVQNYLIGE